MVKRVLILIVLLLSVAGLLLAYNESARQGASDDSASLSGVWVWVKDSDGQTPVKGAVVTLLFNAQGTLDFSAFKPGQEVEDHGRWSVAGQTRDGGLISLELAEMGIKVEGKPYRLNGDVLTLPFTIVNQVPGTSEWHRRASKPVNTDDFIAVAYDVYERALESGASDEAAADAAVNALSNGEFALDARRTAPATFFAWNKSSQGQGYSGVLYAAEPLPLAAAKKARLAKVKANAPKTGLIVRKERGGRVYYILLKFKMPKSDEFKTQSPELPIQAGNFVKDPRTHLYMQPGPGRSDPAKPTAALLFPMNSQKNYRKGRYFVFKNLGEDPAVLNKQFLRAGYNQGDIKVAVDAQVTPKVIADVLSANPGTFYISTHGVQFTLEDGSPGFMMASGTKVVPKAGQSLDDALVQAVQSLGLPEYLLDSLSPVTLPTDRFDHDVFLGVSNPFFEALRAHGGWDMSRSLVYLDACESTALPEPKAGPVPADKVPATVRLFQAKALIGWKTTSDPFVGVRYSQHFFRQAVRKTHSAREIWDHIWRVLTTRRSMYQEDKDLDSNYASERAALASEVKIFDAYGSNQQPYERLTDVVHWLVWLGRWNQDPEKAAWNLESCFKDVWKNGKKGRLGTSPLCNEGYLGSHIPLADEVKEARQLLNGLPEGIVGERWTLADKLAYLKPVGTPYDR
jgi:hypothetical protein